MNPGWRQLPLGTGPAERDLAWGAALLGAIDTEPRPALRWYEAREPALVIGSGQRIADIDAAACAAAGIRVHRRASGGTAVLFVPGLIMQDIALPRAHPLYVDDVSESYRWLGAVWATTLAALGVPAEPVSVAAARADTQANDALLRRACFGGLSPYEVRRRQGALLQVGLYTRWPGRELADLLTLPAAERGALVERLAARVAGLDELVAAPPGLAAVAAAFAAALAQHQGAALEPTEWGEADLAAAEDARPRFAPLSLDAGATVGPPPAS
jgi:lipoate-protein ligase A